MVENVCADSIIKCLEKHLSYEGIHKKATILPISCKQQMMDSLSSPSSVACNDTKLTDFHKGEHLNTLIQNACTNKCDCNGKDESITSDDSVYSEDYNLPADNENGSCDEMRIPQPKDIEAALSNLLYTDSSGFGSLKNDNNCERNRFYMYEDESTSSLNCNEAHFEATECKSTANLEHNSFEDREFEFIKQPIRRSTSLKSYKTPPGTPHRKKAVRFADALGLDLESVRHILDADNPPEIPSSAMKDLKGIQSYENEKFLVGNRYLAACFPQPSTLPDYITRVHENKVILENCTVDDKEMTVTGIIRVANLAFHKRVVVRFTFNEWLTFDEITASYIHNSSDGPTDKFSFTIHVPAWFDTGNRLQFAVMYSVCGQLFWDNNFGCNYVVECFAKTIPGSDGDRTWVHFM